MFSPLSLSRATLAPARQTGLNGIHKAGDAMYRAAANIVDTSFADDDAGGLANDFVSLRSHLLLFQASGKVVKTSTTATGQLIDLLV